MVVFLLRELCVFRGFWDGPIPCQEESHGACVSLSVIRCNNNPLDLIWVGR